MLKIKSVLYSQVRFKGKKIHWSVLQKKKAPKDKALENFDDFYSSVYGNRWRSLRVALLTEHKYVALANNFGDVEKITKALENDGAVDVKSLVNIAKDRLKETDSTAFADNTMYKLDEKIEKIIERQEDREISSIYPKNAFENNLERIPQKITFKNESDNVKLKEKEEENEEEEETLKDIDKVHYKKSLEEVIEKYSEIDESRLIDPEYSINSSLYEFVPTTRIKGMENWIPESEHYKYYSTNNDFPIKMELEKEFDYPENLKLFTYEKGNCSEFIEPKPCITGVLSHFLMNGSSILPPLFLNIKPGDLVLDACAAPGGKSLIMLQTLYPHIITCNDIQESRCKRITKIMNQYICDYNEKWNGKRCLITQSDARSINDYEKYDKILCDVPCTTDRHSLIENDNNIFKPTRIKERLRLPELQSGILTNCLRLLKPGGCLIYSTCSLSPIQNDGVVHMSLQKAFNDYGITTTIKDLSLLIGLFDDIFKFENSKQLKYGQLVLPYLPANFGPMYFCKIERNV